MEAGRDPAHALAQSVAALSHESLPPASLDAARRLLADSMAVAIAGRGGEDVAALVALAAEWGGRGDCTLIAGRTRVPPPVAALVNGTMIQALDFDDTDDPSASHTASTVLAAALALGEARDASGGDFIAAVVAGVEVVARLGRASATNLGFTSTSLYGAFGAAAAAARVLRLDAERTRHALGIVLSQAAGSTQTALDWPQSKHMQSGFAAQAGVLSALLAERGITGVENVFEGRYGFFRLYKEGRYSIEPLSRPWDAPFAIESLSLKPYPSCRATHGPIEACEAIAAEPGFDAADVASVRVSVPQVAFTLAGKPFQESRDPVIAAQFSMAYTVAAALARGRLRLQDFRREAIEEARVRSLMSRVAVEVALGADFTPARVEVSMRDGRRIERSVLQLRGGPDRPLDEAGLRAKVADCLAFAPQGASRLDVDSLLALARDAERFGARRLALSLAAPFPMAMEA